MGLTKYLVWIFFLAMIIGAGCSGSETGISLGITDGKLAACPASPNCVSTQATDPEKQMQPLAYAGDREASLQKVIAIIKSLKRATIVSRQENYLHVEVRSAIFRFVDDVEFYLDDNAKIIHFRSASRTGYSDFGVNRKRMTAISESYRKQL